MIRYSMRIMRERSGYAAASQASRGSSQGGTLQFRLIHPVAGVVAEFSSAYDMMDYLMRKGRQEIPEGAELKDLVFEVSEGGLVLRELVDHPAAEAGPAREGLLCMRSEHLLQ